MKQRIRLYDLFLMSRIFSFRYKLLLSFLLISTVPLLIVSMLVLDESNKTLEEREISANLNSIRQIARNIEQVTTGVNEVSLFLLQNPDIYDFLHLPEGDPGDEADYLTLKIYRTLMFFMNVRTGVSSIFIEGENGLSFTINPMNRDVKVLTGEMEQTVLDLDGVALWTASPHGPGGIPQALVQSRLIKDYYNLDRTLGRVSIQIRAEGILKNFPLSRTGPGEDYYILDRDSRRLMASAPVPDELSGSILPEINASRSRSGYRYVSLEGNRYILFYAVMPATGLMVVHSIPRELIRVRGVVVNQVTAAALVMILVSIVMAFLISRSLFLPLQTLERSMKKVEAEQFEIRIPQNRNDEIGTLIRSFNNMTGRLQELHNEVYIAQVKEKEAELIALETQINPHFLYNTLDTIYWMTKMEGSVESAQMVRALAKLFRIVLSSGREIIPLEKELEHLHYYMEIQQTRFGNRFTFDLNVDPGLEQRPVQKLILQPLVENAIIHGIEKKPDASRISVTVTEEEDGTLCYRVRDDGPGCDPETVRRMLREDPSDRGGGRRGFGLKNVDERLRLAYGAEYGIRLDSAEGEGTEVTVRQPRRGESESTAG